MKVLPDKTGLSVFKSCCGLISCLFFKSTFILIGEEPMIRILLTAALLLPVLGSFAEEVQWTEPNGFDQASPNIPKGTVSNVINYQTSKYGSRQCRVYTPPGYSKTRSEKYPILYLHHGIGGNQDAWTSQNGQAEGNADKIMDFLYAQNDLDVVPMIVVMPMGNMTNTSGDAWQNFESVLINDLAPYIEENYNGSSDPNLRAIAGLSMGAGQSLNFGYKNPKVFTWIGAFSPAPNTIGAAQTIKDIDAVKENVHLAYFGAGTAESMYLNNARNYHNYLKQNGVSPLYLQIEQGLNHERNNWNRQLHQFAQRIFQGITKTVKPDIADVAQSGVTPLAIQRAIMVGNGNSPWGMRIVRSNGGIDRKVFTLNGRTTGTVYQLRAGIPAVRAGK
jgi:enterochelin esterase-like enzyme